MRRRQIRRPRRRIILPKKLLIVLAVVGILVAIVVTIFRVFTIREIKCKSQYGPCSEFIETILRPSIGKHYLSAKREIDTLLQKGMMVKSYSIRMISPNTIEVTVIERKAIAAVANEGKLDELFLIDTDGYVIGQSSSTNLPILIIKTPSEHQVGQMTTAEILFATKILQQLSATYTVKVAYMEQDSILATLPNPITVIFPLQGDTEILFGSLALILSRLNTTSYGTTINGEGFVLKIIDLRFKNPLLK